MPWSAPFFFSSGRAFTRLSDINTGPSAIEPLCDRDRRAAPAEWVEDGVAFVRAGFDNAFEESFGFLRRIPQPFGSQGMNRGNVVPGVCAGLAGHLIQVALQLNSSIGFLGEMQPPLAVELFHQFF